MNEAPSPKIPVANVPHMPQVRCTDTAPTQSFNFNLSNSNTENTTRMPAIPPISSASNGVIMSAPAVTPTNPASKPFSTIPKSIRFIAIMLVKWPPMAPPHAPSAVVTSTSETIPGSADNTDPPLKPSQPSQSKNTPIVAKGTEEPAISLVRPFSYFPIRGPNSHIPTSAPHPPTEWTNVDPAKSTNPSSSRNPPPHFQLPMIG